MPANHAAVPNDSLLHQAEKLACQLSERVRDAASLAVPALSVQTPPLQDQRLLGTTERGHLLMLDWVECLEPTAPHSLLCITKFSDCSSKVFGEQLTGHTNCTGVEPT